MRVIAQRGENDFLIDLEDENHNAIVFDADDGTAYPPFYIESILARGYWEDFNGNEDEIILKLPKEVHKIVEERDYKQFSFSKSGDRGPIVVRTTSKSPEEVHE